ncbi:MAG TPA: hypothetical protein VIM94_10780, partial [Salegentibacter sp.]
MTIKFLIQSSSEIAPIYIRLIEGKPIDIKAKTKYSISPSNFYKGQIKFNRVSGSAALKELIQEENKELESLQENLDDLKKTIIHRFNNRKENEVINTHWLKEIL